MSKTTIRNIIIAVILVSSSGAVFGIMMFEVIEEGSRLNEQIEVLEREQAREVSYFKLKSIAEETATDREFLRSHFLLRESDSIDFLTRVETMALEANVNLNTKELKLIEGEAGGPEWIQVGFTFSSSRERVQNFIKVLETLPYVLRVTNTDMSAKSSTEWEVNLTMQVRVLSYDE